jgi:hypothetical protein
VIVPFQHKILSSSGNADIPESPLICQKSHTEKQIIEWITFFPNDKTDYWYWITFFHMIKQIIKRINFFQMIKQFFFFFETRYPAQGPTNPRGPNDKTDYWYWMNHFFPYDETDYWNNHFFQMIKQIIE